MKGRMDERQIEQLAPKLGWQAASRVIPDATAERVRARLRERERRAWWRNRVLQAAAAVIFVVSAAVLVERVMDAPVAMTLVAPVELQDLAAAELSAVLDSLEADRPVADMVPASLNDLDDAELRALLELMEG